MNPLTPQITPLAMEVINNPPCYLAGLMKSVLIQTSARLRAGKPLRASKASEDMHRACVSDINRQVPRSHSHIRDRPVI